MSSTTPAEPTPTSTSPGRRKAAAVCLVLAPLAMLAEMATWPVGSDGSTAAQLQSAATSPTAYTLAWIAETTNAVLLLAGVVGLVGYLRNRGRTLAFVGAILAAGGQVGVITGGGFNAAIVPLAQQPQRDVAIHVLDTFNAQPVLPVFAALIWLGLVGTVLLFVAAVRGRLVRWWVLVLVVVALVTVPLLDDDLYGLAAAATGLPIAVAEIAVGVALFRTRRSASPASSPRPVPVPAASEATGTEAALS